MKRSAVLGRRCGRFKVVKKKESLLARRIGIDKWLPSFVCQDSSTSYGSLSPSSHNVAKLHFRSEGHATRALVIQSVRLT